MTHSIEASETILSKEYKVFLKEIKEKILSSQIKAALAVNQELLSLYWEIGTKILLKQKSEGWGAKTVENLAKDLKTAFPNIRGFSLTNIKYMVQFAKEYSDCTISQQAVGQIPWGHNILLLQKPGDNPSIGLLLCKTKDKIIVEYALRDINHTSMAWNQ